MGDQIASQEPFPDQARRKSRHLGQSVQVADVMLPRELADVAVKVLVADLVECALVGALDHGPETLDAVGVRLAANVLGR